MKLVFAGGGTGGHLFPALALAEEFKKRDSATEIVFIGGLGGLEEKIVPRYGYPLKLLSVQGVKRTKGVKRLLALVRAFNSTLRAIAILRSIRPDGVIGSGSYSSAPVVFAAKLLGIKTAILEQNALPGLTNKILGKSVDRVYISFEEARKFFPVLRTVLAGNPMRGEMLTRISDKSREPVWRKGKKFTVLVFGGSQGAMALNAAFLDAAEYLTDIWGDLRVIHQTGQKGYQYVKEAYERKHLKAELYEFIDYMADAYYCSDLVVCRAGATSIAEITAFGLASVLVPYPFASDNHQEVNAGCLAREGAALMIPQDKLTGRTLSDAIRRLYENPAELEALRSRARSLGKPGAAETIADNFSAVIESKSSLTRSAAL
ncbi:MAG TPA: undecaprenyldiphospho-muramoylpentapeptide beta-N-acetylglucosaminyltransferase [Thermodesulfobacteriota bacterium]|nr:undecaprenyldiphospho-muramoylpentapeptide beta-N-acetylglucosaminyltransferase [Thermodesulfobacteriota bacterium]